MFRYCYEKRPSLKISVIQLTPSAHIEMRQLTSDEIFMDISYLSCENFARNPSNSYEIPEGSSCDEGELYLCHTNENDRDL